MPKRCACLTMDDPGGWTIDTHLAFPPLGKLGWQVDQVRWRTDSPRWDDYDAVYIGTPWDYPEDSARFMAVLEEIDRSRAVLVNDLSLVRWTLSKTYLRDLESRGADIVPSRWHEDFSPEAVNGAFDFFGTDKIIVKPTVGANAIDTFLLDRESLAAERDKLAVCFSHRAHVVQPFIENIRTEGEFSLFYFNAAYSHAIRKIPAPGDFRVQEEYGANIVAIEPDAALAEAGQKTMRCVSPVPVYARIDLVRGDDGRYLVMELELIEPSLYLRMDDAAPEKFARAFDAGVPLARRKGETTTCEIS